MAWTSPMTFTDAQALTAAQLNTHLRDNLNETMPALATDPTPGGTGGFFVVDDPKSIVERHIKAARVDQTGSTITSASFVDLADVGPSVEVETGSSAFVFFNCRIWNDTLNGQSDVSYAVSGSTTITASDDWAFTLDGVAASNTWSGGTWDLRTDLNPGLNTFTMKYRSGGVGNAFFKWRTIAVWPL